MLYVLQRVNFSFLSRFKNSQSFWIQPAFYLAWALLIASVSCYLVFMFKTYLQNQKIAELNDKLVLYGTKEEKTAEDKFLDYKKKIEDFNTLIDKHTTSLKVFNFLEKKTLPNIWFSSINILETKYEISLVGESETVAVLGRQVALFEESKGYIKDVTVLSSKMGTQGRTQFSLTLSLDPSIFAYPGQPNPI